MTLQDGNGALAQQALLHTMPLYVGMALVQSSFSHLHAAARHSLQHLLGYTLHARVQPVGACHALL